MKQAAPQVSVLIPLYNHQDFIEDCLYSVLNQDYPNIELIIHDDCSTDNSYQRAQEWVTRNSKSILKIRLIRSTSNKGLIASLNYLVSLANGQYILSPLASDDLLLPKSISCRVKKLEERKDWLAVFGDAQAINDAGCKLADSYLFDIFKSNRANLISDKVRRMEIIRHWSIPGPVILYRREAFDPHCGVGPYNESLALEDRDMYLRLLEKNQLGYIDRPVAKYRLHANNTMNSPSIRIPGVLALHTPLKNIATSKHLDRWERFTAKHLAHSYKWTIKRLQAKNRAAKITYNLGRSYHKQIALFAAAIYFIKAS